jgi:hypothetical protein
MLVESPYHRGISYFRSTKPKTIYAVVEGPDTWKLQVCTWKVQHLPLLAAEFVLVSAVMVRQCKHPEGQSGTLSDRNNEGLRGLPNYIQQL